MPLSTQKPRSISIPRPAIDRLATELLTDVFRFSAYSSYAHTTFDVSPEDWLPQVHLALGAISLVCRRWRNIIVRTPMLWTTVLAHVDGHMPSDSYIPLFLSRSGNLPLSIYISRQDTSPSAFNFGEREAVRVFLDAFLENLHRVSTLSIETYQSSSLPNATCFFQSVNGPFKMLDTLVLHSDIGGSSFFYNPTPSIAAMHKLNSSNIAAPLRVLSINGQDLLHMLDGSTGLRASLQNIETLAITRLTFTTRHFTHHRVDALFDIISSLPRLTTLAFDGFKVEYSAPSSAPHHSPKIRQIPATSTPLRQLVLIGMESKSIGHVLRRIPNAAEVLLVACVFTQPLQLTTDSCKRTKILLDDASTAGISVDLHRSDFEMMFTPSFKDHGLFSKLTSLLMIDCGKFSGAIQIAPLAGSPAAPVTFLPRRYYFTDFDSSEPTAQES